MEASESTDSAPAAARPDTVSIVVELENALDQGETRARRGLGALSRELGTPSLDPAPRTELLVGFDPDEWGEEYVRRWFRGHPLSEQVERVETVAVPGGGYNEVKNAGAALARGDAVLFFDSDVIPGEGWWKAVVEAFDAPEVEVVSPACHVDGGRLVDRLYAVVSTFPVRGRPRPDDPVAGLWLNSLALRRGVFEERPLPEGGAMGRRDTYAWARELVEEDGRTVRKLEDVSVSHPAPTSVGRLLRRGLRGGGHAVRYLEEFRGFGRAAAVLGGLYLAVRRGARGALGLVRHRGEYGFTLTELVTGQGISLAYHGSMALGALRAGMGRSDGRTPRPNQSEEETR